MQQFKIGMNIREVITARNMNEIRDAVMKVNDNWLPERGGACYGGARRDGEIRIKHGASAQLDTFSAVELTGMVLTPTNCDTFAFETPTFTAALPVGGGLPWALLMEPADPNELARARIIGLSPAVVTIRDTSHRYVQPIAGSSTGALETCESGSAKLLVRGGTTGAVWCVIQLGVSGAAAAVAGASHAPFALSIGGGTATVNVAAGIASRNGVKVSVAGGTVTATASGYVYVATTFSTVSGWATGNNSFSFGVASGLSDLVAVTGGSITTECYPVGYVTVTGGVVTEVESFKVPMAIFLKAGTCTTGA